MTDVWLLAWFSEVNWSLCKHTDASVWPYIEIVFDGMAAGPQLLAVAAAKSWLPGCD